MPSPATRSAERLRTGTDLLPAETDPPVVFQAKVGLRRYSQAFDPQNPSFGQIMADPQNHLPSVLSKEEDWVRNTPVTLQNAGRFAQIMRANLIRYQNRTSKREYLGFPHPRPKDDTTLPLTGQIEVSYKNGVVNKLIVENTIPLQTGSMDPVLTKPKKELFFETAEIDLDYDTIGQSVVRLSPALSDRYYRYTLASAPPAIVKTSLEAIREAAKKSFQWTTRYRRILR